MQPHNCQEDHEGTTVGAGSAHQLDIGPKMELCQRTVRTSNVQQRTEETIASAPQADPAAGDPADLHHLCSG